MLTIKEIISATQGKAVNADFALTIKGVAIDSRAVQKGYLFIAIIGHRLDGHQFIKKAIRRGACLILASDIKFIPRNCPAVIVADTTKALGHLSAYHRSKFNIPVIAVTGSAGKTTTKECIAHAVSSKFCVLKSDKSENNHIGVPLTLLKLNASHQVAVIELGTNRFGDIPWVASLASEEMSGW